MNTTRNYFSCAQLKSVLLLPMAACLFSSLTCRAVTSHSEAPLYGSCRTPLYADSTAVTPKDSMSKKPIDISSLSTPPTFPGGDQVLVLWLSQHIVYPEGAMRRGEKGRVIVSFHIDEKGKITQAKVERGVSADLDAEALRVISTMPDWKPGIKDGTPVEIKYMLPITFKIPEPVGNEKSSEKQEKSDPVANQGSTGNNSLDQLANLVSKAMSNTPSQDNTSNIPIELFDVKPIYPGGDIALSEFVRKTIQYPLEAMKKGVSGRSAVSFFVESDGKVSTAAIEKSISPEIDAEALRIVNSMPNWKPATSGGKAIRAKMTLVINFVIPEASVSKKYGVNFRNTDPEISRKATFGKGEKALRSLLIKEMKKVPVIERCAFEGKVDFLIYLDTKGTVMGASISTKEADQKALAPGVTSAMEDVVIKLPAFNPALLGKNAVNVEYAISMNLPLTK